MATGAVVGTIAGVLIAPKSGKETIEDVKEYLFTHLNELEKGIVNTYKKSIKESKS